MRFVKYLFAALALVTGNLPALPAADRPNILWIVSEDNASHWLGCYGNTEAKTPRLDALAAGGTLFNHAYSNAPVCAVARSTILNGAYAVTQGTQHMRSRHPIPATFKPYVTYLREQGYYCTNNAKTDYNFLGNDEAIWDVCSEDATYQDRPKGKPFFAVFNLGISHESTLFSDKIAANRKNGTIPNTPRLDPATVTVPPYLPDLPEIRSDIAIYHDNMTALDTAVGKLLDKLKSAGLADDTIIFYYSDHGGILPRGKRYLLDTGVRVPMLLHVPEKWRSLSPFKSGQRVDENVAFVDLAPTLLSLVGLDKPSQMQGRAFLGSKRQEPAETNDVFLFADRFDEIYGLRRGLTDGRWKYIRNFHPNLPGAPYSSYQFGQAGWLAWQKAWQDGKLDARFNQIWETPQPSERLFDTQGDPWEIHNLAADPAHAERLAAMRGRLKTKMIETADTGLIPEPMWAELALKKPIASYLAERKGDLPALVELAFAASEGNAKNLPHFQSLLTDKDPVTRYWATEGCLILGKSASPAADALVGVLADSHSAIRVAAANELFTLGNPSGKAALLSELESVKEVNAERNLVNTLMRLNVLNDIPDTWVKRTLNDKKASEYLKRLATRVNQERK